MPRSRTNPQFNGESLPETLTPWQIRYERLAELGSHRGKARNVEASPNAYSRIRGFRNYADYALTKPFAAGLARTYGQLVSAFFFPPSPIVTSCRRELKILPTWSEFSASFTSSFQGQTRGSSPSIGFSVSTLSRITYQRSLFVSYLCFVPIASAATAASASARRVTA
jgi:hypothetical protein